MNQNVKSLFVAGAVLATALSCSKNESDPANPITCKLVSMRIIRPNDAEQRMITDQNGNVARIEHYAVGQLSASSTLTYNNGKAVIIDSSAKWGDAPAKQTGITTYVLGSNGNAVSSYHTGAADESTDSVYYTYDASGYVTGKLQKFFKPTANVEKVVEQTYTHTYTYVNGVCTQEDIVAVGVISNEHSRASYGYYETPAGVSYQIPNMSTRELDYPFLGKPGSALLKSVNYSHVDGSKEESVYSYTYDYDESGKPVKGYIKTVKGGSAGFEATLGFGYDCN